MHLQYWSYLLGSVLIQLSRYKNGALLIFAICSTYYTQIQLALFQNMSGYWSNKSYNYQYLNIFHATSVLSHRLCFRDQMTKGFLTYNIFICLGRKYDFWKAIQYDCLFCEVEIALKCSMPLFILFKN